MAEVHKFVFNPFQENTFIVHDGKVCVVFDPGCSNKEEQAELIGFIEKNSLEIKAVLQTHAHVDHVLGAHSLLTKYTVPYYMHAGDLPTLHAVADYAHVYGFNNYIAPRDPDLLLSGGETLVFGNIKTEVLFTPGHAPGHVVYYFPEDGFVVNGDVLFAGSFGRTDLPGGDFDTLKRSINEIMFQLPEETIVYCGHGPETTIGIEKRSNYINQF